MPKRKSQTGFFEIETVLGEREVEGRVEVLIKWKNDGEKIDENSWEPLSNL